MDPFASKVIEEGAKLVVGILKDLCKTAKVRVEDEAKLFVAGRQYCQRYEDRHGQIKVLGMSEPISLRQIYTTVHLIDPDYLQAFFSPTEMEARLREQSSRRLSPPEETFDGITIANRVKFLTILGQPGAGKSTFLRRMGLEAFEPRRSSTFKHSCLPVLIELKEFRYKDFDLEALIRDEFRTCGFPEVRDPNKPDFALTAIQEGKLLILLDGLDEVPRERLDQVIREVQNFVDHYSRNRYLISCRTAYYKTFFPRFTDVILADFDDAQVQVFLRNWFQKPVDEGQKIAEEFWALLQEPQHEATLELARTPLLLTFLSLVYDRKHELPGNRSLLYKKALEILLQEWAAEKRVHGEHVYEGLHPDLECLMLARIAGPAFRENKVFFAEADLIQRIEDFLREDLQAPKLLNGRAVLDAIEIQQGLLVERAHGIFSFSHLTLHEYLAACYFREFSSPKELVDDYLFDPRWREVFLLYAGICRADELLLYMSGTVTRRVAGWAKVAKLVAWAEGACIPTSDLAESSARRAIALCSVVALILATALTDRRKLVHLRYLADSRALSLARRLSQAFSPRDMQDNADSALDTSGTLEWLNPQDPGEPELTATEVKMIATDPALVRLIRFVGDLEGFGIFKCDFKALKHRLENLGKIGRSSQMELEKLIATAIADVLEQLGVVTSLHVWSLDDIQDLETFLSASSLIKECRDAALSLSVSAWEIVVKGLIATK